MRNAKTMSYLYSGLGYEYYTASLLWRMGYEAYKMDADFGFDVMAYNQKDRSFNGDRKKTPYLFQVKMRRIYEFETKISDAGKRFISRQNFEFNKEDFERLLGEENAYLVCFFVDATGDKEKIVGSFWLNNYQIKSLYEGYSPTGNSYFLKFFHINENKIILSALLETQADAKNIVSSKINDIFKQLNQIKTSTSDIKLLSDINYILRLSNSLVSWIDRSSLINANSNVNIYLYVTNPDGKELKKLLSREQVNFDNFNKNFNVLPIKK